MRCWLEETVDRLLSGFFVDFDDGSLMFLNPGVTFWTLFDYFGKRWLLVATLQAHLAPQARKLAYFTKNDSKIGSLFGCLLGPWAPLSSGRERPAARRVSKVARS